MTKTGSSLGSKPTKNRKFYFMKGKNKIKQRVFRRILRKTKVPNITIPTVYADSQMSSVAIMNLFKQAMRQQEKENERYHKEPVIVIPQTIGIEYFVPLKAKRRAKRVRSKFKFEL